MANQYKNKVIFNGVTLIDLSDTTAVQSDVASGKSFYTASGQRVLGTGSNGNAISVVDTTDSHGGTIRTITAVDISDTTAIASDVASGKYFYTANGIKTLGTGSGGSGGTGQIATGTVTGDGTNILEIPCNFAPDLIYVYGDMSGDVANRGVISLTIIKDVAIYGSSDSSTSKAEEYSFTILHDIIGYNESDTSTVHATYSNNILIIDTVQNFSSAKWRSGQVYNYELSTIGTGSGSTPSVTKHTIHFDFSDETDTDIDVYYDDALLATMIRAYTPTAYGQKTVTLAQLDGVTWYEPANIPLNTQLVDYNAVLTGYTIDSDGNIIESETYNCITDYILIDPTMTFSFKSEQYSEIGFYNTQKNPIGTVMADNIKESAEDYVASGYLTPSIIPLQAAYVVLKGNSYGIEKTLSLIRTA